MDRAPFNITNFMDQMIPKPLRMKGDPMENVPKLLEYIEMIVSRDFKLGGGLCLPTTCETEDISRALNQCESLSLIPSLSPLHYFSLSLSLSFIYLCILIISYLVMYPDNKNTHPNTPGL